MSATRSENQPTFSYKADPVLNLSPLIDLYPHCLTHVVDTDDAFYLPALKSPTILSCKRGILNSSISYQTGFSSARSSRCMLTIAAFFLSWTYDLKTILTHIIPATYNVFKTPEAPTINFARIYPQSFIILTNQFTSPSDISPFIVPEPECHEHMSFFFTLRLNEDPIIYPKISGEVIQKPFGSLAFNCSTLESCGNKIAVVVPTVAKVFHDSWQFYDFDGHSSGRHPFDRGSQVGMQEAMDGFVLEHESKRDTAVGICPPHFSQALSVYASPPKEFIPTGRTAVVRFVTTAGVFVSKSSYRVYFSPFLPQVWLGILLSAGVIVATMIGVLKMQEREEAGNGRLVNLTVEVVIWILAVAIGQYKHSGIPLSSPRLNRRVISVIVPVIVSWFMLSTFLLNVYSAVFNSDATQPFYYITNYTEFFQLPLDTLTYILVEESYYKPNPPYDPKQDCTIEIPRFFCYAHKDVPAACTIRSAIRTAHERWKLDATTVTKLSCIAERLERIQMLRFSSKLLYATIPCLSRILAQSKQPVAFLMCDQDFQKYWKIFLKVMQKNPSVKVANNFGSADLFLSEPVMYEFTSGLHPALKGTVVARMKVLLSSGIYGLWEKWRCIKFIDGGLQYVEKKLSHRSKVQPLSFDNSGTSWIFQAQVAAWLVATAIFAFERILHFLS